MVGCQGAALPVLDLSQSSEAAASPPTVFCSLPKAAKAQSLPLQDQLLQQHHVYRVFTTKEGSAKGGKHPPETEGFKRTLSCMQVLTQGVCPTSSHGRFPIQSLK